MDKISEYISIDGSSVNTSGCRNQMGNDSWSHQKTRPGMARPLAKPRKWLILRNPTWLRRAGLKESTEAPIMVAQGQALGTRSIEAGIYHTRQDLRVEAVQRHP